MSTAGEVAADLAGLGLMAAEKAHGVVVLYGAKLQAAVKAKAKVSRSVPRPGPSGTIEGPRFLTGDYNRSINRRTTKRAKESTAEVGTDAPQGHRLEVGFVGTDSLGRNFDQKPYPHFGPALDEIAKDFEEAVAAAGVPVT